jgi:MFS family permease
MESPDRSGTFRWVLIAVSTLALVISNGLAIGGLPPFYKPIREEFVALGAVDISHAETFIANGATITFLMSGVFSLIGGWLLTRFAIKPLMVVGCVLLGSGLVMHAQAASAEAVYIARFLMGASLGFIGVAPCVVLVSRWFEHGRGTALGIVLTGTSVGGFIIPQIAEPLIRMYGWRSAMLAVSALVWLVLLPAIMIFIREPSAKPASSETARSIADGLLLRDVVRTPLFWLFALCAAAVFYPIFVTSQQFLLYLQSPKIGVSSAAAASAQSALFAVSVGGKFLAGFLSDKARSANVMAACAGLMFASTLVLFFLTATTALLFLLPFALGYGGTFVLLQRLAADLFGRREIGKILGLVTLVEVSGAAIGGHVTGYLADQAGGDYTYAFYGVTAAAAIAFLTALSIPAFANKHGRSAV